VSLAISVIIVYLCFCARLQPVKQNFILKPILKFIPKNAGLAFSYTQEANKHAFLLLVALFCTAAQATLHKSSLSRHFI
jgi:hypothetical protein